MPLVDTLDGLNRWLEKQDSKIPTPPFPGAIFDHSTRRWHKPKTNISALEDIKSHFDSGTLSPDETARLITRWRNDNSTSNGYLKKWLIKQATTITSAGMHSHQDYSSGQPHPVSQHHRHGFQDVTVPEEYWKDPAYFDEEADEEKPQPINITQIARAHGLDMRSLHRAMQQHYGARRMSSQIERYRAYDPERDKWVNINETRLLPSQIQTAHQLATELKRRSGRMTGKVRVIRPANVRQVAEPLFAMWLENQKRAYHTDRGKYPYHPVRVINHEEWFSRIPHAFPKHLSKLPKTMVTVQQSIADRHPEIRQYILETLEQNQQIVSSRLKAIRLLETGELKRLGMLGGNIATLGVYFFDSGTIALNRFYFKHFQEYKHDFEMTLIHEASHALWDDLAFQDAREWMQLWREEIKDNQTLDIYGQDDYIEAFPELIAQIRRSDAPNAKQWFKQNGAKKSVEFLEKLGFV